MTFNVDGPVSPGYGVTGMSLPTKTGVPDGFPVGDPPGGSTVTAYVAPATTAGS
jgi:hypothetical protein